MSAHTVGADFMSVRSPGRANVAHELYGVGRHKVCPYTTRRKKTLDANSLTPGPSPMGEGSSMFARS